MQNKGTDYITNIMSKCFLPKALHYFFFKYSKNQKLRDFRRSSFGDYIHVTFNSIATNSASGFKHLYIFYNFHPKDKLCDLEQFHI